MHNKIYVARHKDVEHDVFPLDPGSWLSVTSIEYQSDEAC